MSNQLRIPFRNYTTPVESLIGSFLDHEGSQYIITDAYMETMENARLDLKRIPARSEMLTLDKIMTFALPNNFA